MVTATLPSSSSQMARLVSKIPWILMTLLAFESIEAAHAEAEEAIERLQRACAPFGADGCARSTAKLRVGPGAEGRLSRLVLERGRATLLETPFAVTRVAVGDPEIADVVVVDSRQINIVPLQLGETNPLLWGAGTKLRAAIDLEVGNSHYRVERELKRVLGNETIELDGTHHAIVLKGMVEGPVQMKHAVAVAHALIGQEEGDVVSDQSGPGTSRLVNLLTVGGNQQVMIEVIVAEMDRTLTRRLGTNFAGVYKSGGTDVNILSLLQGLPRLENIPSTELLIPPSRVNFISTIAKGSDSLDVFIEAVQSDGLIKILAEPNLVARSGETAEFLVGGEVPIPVPQGARLARSPSNSSRSEWESTLHPRCSLRTEST